LNFLSSRLVATNMNYPRPAPGRPENLRVQVADRGQSSNSGVLGPVLRPPWRRQRLFRMAGQREDVF
jgi:hypothetical protein